VGSISTVQLDPKIVSYIQESNESKNPSDPLALYLIGNNNEEGELNPNLSSQIVRFKQLAKIYYLSIDIMNDADIGGAIARAQKAHPGRPIDLLVLQTHCEGDVLRFTPDSSGHYGVKNVKPRDFALLSPGCVISLSACESYASRAASIAAKIAAVAKRVVYASKSFLPIDHFFYTTDLKNRSIEWHAFDPSFATPISVKLRYDEEKKRVIETAPKETALEEIAQSLEGEAKEGCQDSQIAYANLALKTRKLDQAATYYKMAMTNQRTASPLNLNLLANQFCSSGIRV